MRGLTPALLALLLLSLIRPNAVGDPLGVHLVGAWLGEGNAEDFVGFADGTPSAGLTYVVGQFGQAFSFNGSSEVVLPDNAFDSLAGGPEITIAAWLKTTQGGDFTAVMFEGSWMLYFDAANNGFPSPVWDGDWGNRLTSGIFVSDGNWHHLASVYDNGTAKVYVDGVLSVSSTRTLASQSANRLASGIFADYVGQLDDVGLFDTALDTADINLIMNNGLESIPEPGSCALLLGLLGGIAVSIRWRKSPT